MMDRKTTSILKCRFVGNLWVVPWLSTLAPMPKLQQVSQQHMSQIIIIIAIIVLIRSVIVTIMNHEHH